MKKIIILFILLFGIVIQSYGNENNNSSIVKKIKFNGDVDTIVMRLTYKDNSIFYLTGKDSRYFYVDQISGEVYFEANQEYKEKHTFYITGVAKDSLGNFISKDYEIEAPDYVDDEGLDFFMFFWMIILPFLFLRF